MAARKVSNAAAMALAVAVVAMLVVAATAMTECGVERSKVMGACLSYCGGNGGKLGECCDALRPADMSCLCTNYWGRLQGTSYARCATDIQSKCHLKGC